MHAMIRMAILITTSLFYVEVSKNYINQSGSASSMDSSIFAGF